MELKELYGPQLKRAEDMIRREGAPCVFLLPDGTFHPGTGTGVRPLLETLDVLIDGPFLQADRSLELNFRGSRNQRILRVPQSLAEGRAVAETSARWLAEY